jgi:hypothetical protein
MPPTLTRAAPRTDESGSHREYDVVYDGGEPGTGTGMNSYTLAGSGGLANSPSSEILFDR